MSIYRRSRERPETLLGSSAAPGTFKAIAQGAISNGVYDVLRTGFVFAICILITTQPSSKVPYVPTPHLETPAPSVIVEAPVPSPSVKSTHPVAPCEFKDCNPQ